MVWGFRVLIRVESIEVFLGLGRSAVGEGFEVLVFFFLVRSGYRRWVNYVGVFFCFYFFRCFGRRGYL